jgi:hypothetical protein
VALEQKLFQPADGVQHLGTAQATDNADIAKLLHGAPAGFGFCKKERLWAKAGVTQNPLSPQTPDDNGSQPPSRL